MHFAGPLQHGLDGLRSVWDVRSWECAIPMDEPKQMPSLWGLVLSQAEPNRRTDRQWPFIPTREPMQKLWAEFAWVSEWLASIDKMADELVKHEAQIYQKIYNVGSISVVHQSCSIVK